MMEQKRTHSVEAGCCWEGRPGAAPRRSRASCSTSQNVLVIAVTTSWKCHFLVGNCGPQSHTLTTHFPLYFLSFLSSFPPSLYPFICLSVPSFSTFLLLFLSPSLPLLFFFSFSSFSTFFTSTLNQMIYFVFHSWWGTELILGKVGHNKAMKRCAKTLRSVFTVCHAMTWLLFTQLAALLGSRLLGVRAMAQSFMYLEHRPHKEIIME